MITTEPFPPRSVPAERLAHIAHDMGLDAAAEPDPRRALGRALVSAQRHVVVAGSLYLAGAAIEFLDAQCEQERHDQQR